MGHDLWYPPFLPGHLLKGALFTSFLVLSVGILFLPALSGHPFRPRPFEWRQPREGGEGAHDRLSEMSYNTEVRSLIERAAFLIMSSALPGATGMSLSPPSPSGRKPGM